ncbi:MAG: type II toxin-antitoxin system VapC family toxin [Gracilimonas sp.]
MTEYLLDTNICIYIIKKKPKIVFDRFNTCEPGSIAISSVTLAELQYGISKSSKPQKNQEALELFLLPLDILDFNGKAAVEYGKIRADLERKGTPIGSLDLLIAAHARSLETTLVTNNEKEFRRVEKLNVENWIQS